MKRENLLQNRRYFFWYFYGNRACGLEGLS